MLLIPGTNVLLIYGSINLKTEPIKRLFFKFAASGNSLVMDSEWIIFPGWIYFSILEETLSADCLQQV